MASSPSFGLVEQSDLSQERKRSYLRVHAVNVYVRDQDRSLRFYLDQLGFTLAFDVQLQSGQRWVGVSPPDGTAVLTLCRARSRFRGLQAHRTSIAGSFCDGRCRCNLQRMETTRCPFFSYAHPRCVKYQPPQDGTSGRSSMLLGKQTPIWGGVFMLLRRYRPEYFCTGQLRRDDASGRRSATYGS